MSLAWTRTCGISNPSDSPVERVTHLLSHSGPAVFVEMPNGKFEILTKFDLMDTVAGIMEQKR